MMQKLENEKWVWTQVIEIYKQWQHYSVKKQKQKNKNPLRDL